MLSWRVKKRGLKRKKTDNYRPFFKRGADSASRGDWRVLNCYEAIALAVLFWLLLL